jgi:hypothetical protein
MRNNPFGLPESAVDRFLREERERTKLYKDLLGGGAVAEAMREANRTRDLMRGLDFDKPYRGIVEMMEQDRKQLDFLKSLTSTPWALSVTETARSIMQRDADLIEQQRRMSSSVLDTMRAFDANRSTVAAAIAAASSGETYRKMVADMLPQVTAFSAIAERMRMVDMMTLRASDGVVESATVIAAEMVIETQRIAEAIAAVPTGEDSAALFDELFETIAAYLAKLGPNTIAELNAMGLVQWSGWLFGFLGFVLAIVALQPNPSAEQAKKIAALNEKVEVLHQDNERLAAADAHASEAYLDKLPKAELTRDATLRRKPGRAGEVVLKAKTGQVVAIEKKQGRWRLIVFRDPLSNQLARAWVYETALMPLAPALGEDGR